MSTTVGGGGGGGDGGLGGRGGRNGGGRGGGGDGGGGGGEGSDGGGEGGGGGVGGGGGLGDGGGEGGGTGGLVYGGSGGAHSLLKMNTYGQDRNGAYIIRSSHTTSVTPTGSRAKRVGPPVRVSSRPHPRWSAFVVTDLATTAVCHRPTLLRPRWRPRQTQTPSALPSQANPVCLTSHRPADAW